MRLYEKIKTKKMKPTFQKNGKNWTDESGIEIPFNRVSKLERSKEMYAGRIFRIAEKINSALCDFKDVIQTAVDDVTKEINEEYKAVNNKVKNTKGNYTWYNFDRSVKIEVNINEQVRFDEAKIAAARELFDKFIEKNVQGTDDVVRQLINSAFANTKGGLDSKRVLSLLRYRTKIKDKQFHAALDLIQDSISRPSSKRYFRIWAKDMEGKYQNIELNFSAI